MGNGSEKRKLTIEDMRVRCERIGVILLSDVCDGNKTKLKVSTKEGYIIFANMGDLEKSKDFIKQPFMTTNPFVIDNIKLWLINNNKPFILKEGQLFIEGHRDLIWICPTHGEFNGSWTKIRVGQGCNLCKGKKVVLSNSMYSMRPDLVKYFRNEEDSKLIKPNSTTIIDAKCPTCKFEKPINGNDLFTKGFNCPFCSGIIGMSYFERVLYSLFSELNIEFQREYNKPWACGKRYDFYIEYNDEQYIVEAHGVQHYEAKFNMSDVSLEEQEINDALKYELAITNGIKKENYIVIDCRKNSISWIVYNFKEKLGQIFNISEDDVRKAIRNSQSSVVEKSWGMWDSGEYENTLELANELKFSRYTVTTWLKIGKEFGKCSYNKDIEILKGIEKSKISNEKRHKPIIQWDMNGNKIKEFKNAREANQETGVAFQSISKNAKGKLPHAGFFIWTFKNIEVE